MQIKCKIIIEGILSNLTSFNLFDEWLGSVSIREALLCNAINLIDLSVINIPHLIVVWYGGITTGNFGYYLKPFRVN